MSFLCCGYKKIFMAAGRNVKNVDMTRSINFAINLIFLMAKNKNNLLK